MISPAVKASSSNGIAARCLNGEQDLDVGFGVYSGELVGRNSYHEMHLSVAIRS